MYHVLVQEIVKYASENCEKSIIQEQGDGVNEDIEIIEYFKNYVPGKSIEDVHQEFNMFNKWTKKWKGFFAGGDLFNSFTPEELDKFVELRQQIYELRKDLKTEMKACSQVENCEKEIAITQNYIERLTCISSICMFRSSQKYPDLKESYISFSKLIRFTYKYPNNLIDPKEQTSIFNLMNVEREAEERVREQVREKYDEMQKRTQDHIGKVGKALQLLDEIDKGCNVQKQEFNKLVALFNAVCAPSILSGILLIMCLVLLFHDKEVKE